MAKSAYKSTSQDYASGVIHYLLITLILSLGFGQLLRFEFSGVPFYLHDLLVVALLALQGRSLIGLKLPRSLQLFLLGLAIGWGNALLHYPLTSLLVPSLYTLRLLAYLALYLGLAHAKIQVSKLYFLLSGCITLVIGYAQYIFLPDMRVFQYLGWDDHLSRLTLPHFDPTFTGVMLVLTVLSLYPGYRRWTTLFYPAILFTMARSVWLSMGLVGLAYGIQARRWGKLAIAFILFVVYLSVRPPRFGEGNNLLRTYSIASRVSSDWSYVQQYRSDLLLGRGFNTLILDQAPGKLPNHATGPNNSYLYLLLNTGVLGLIGWGQFLWSLFRSSRYRYLLLFFALSSLFNNVMFYPFTLLWVLLLHATVPTSA